MSWLTRRPSSDSGFRPSDPSRTLPERNGFSTPSVTGTNEFNDLKFQIYEQLLQELDFDVVQSLESANLRKAVEDAAATLITAREVPLTRTDRLRLVQEVGDEILGLGPLEPLIADPSVTEIMVNGPRQVYVERNGRLNVTTTTFRDNAHVMRIIERIIAPLGRRIDEASPMVDARLLDGSRVNAVIPPLAVDGPGLTIRKFAREAFQVEDLIRFGSLTAGVATFLEGCVRGKVNIVVSGGTGTGKTTLLNVLSSFIPSNERLVTIEDPCELQIRQPHIMRLETRSANVEGRGEITQRQLVRNALRMRPDRIIVGEVRGGEAFDMLQAMNTGHDGSLTTVHSNSPRDALARIENMVLMADLALPSRAIREQVASAINVIVQLSRMRDGSRRVTYVTEVTGMELHDSLAVRDIYTFRYDRTEIDAPVSGQLEPTGYRPKIIEKCLAEGVEISLDLFGPTRP
ncbi:MAG TPA: CpaF family protein, partial [Chloroflexota bacterium]|nr:CpaF family protein [Chloroflexota bacterium]